MNIILLSGGSGKRLWPLSNDIRSKQFIKFFKKEDGSYESMVQRVYRQIKKVDTDATVTIATSKTQVSAIQSALNAFNRELLARHIRTCVVTSISHFCQVFAYSAILCPPQSHKNTIFIFQIFPTSIRKSYNL